MSLIAELRGKAHALSKAAPLQVALDVQFEEFELATVRVWQLFSVVGIVTSAVIAATVSLRLGLACASASTVFLGWFLFVGKALARGGAGRWVGVANASIESAAPWIFILVLTYSEGAAYAIGSWVPPMLFCGILLAHVVRMRVVATLVVGIGSAIAYPALYLVVLREHLPEALHQLVLYQPGMQLSRAITLIASGILCAYVARALRAAIGRADVVVREQDLFGKYQLLRPVAAGGMGSVYEAIYCPEGGFERRVAIKRIHPRLAARPRFVDGFRSEAEISSHLTHPNIVQVRDFGKAGSSYFLAMEYVEGMTLSAFMARAAARRRQLPPQVVAFIGLEVLAGLAHAHVGARSRDGRSLGVVHRDLCPQNVLLSRHGEVKISDFGVARLLRNAKSDEPRAIAGHAAYMAPEQALGEALDARSDLFPVGVILWELLVGCRLFHRPTESATLLALLSEEVRDVSLDRPDLDPAWDGVVARALEREPARRHASASQMADRLEAVCPVDRERGRAELSELVEVLAAVSDHELTASSELETEPISTAELPPAK